jgi:PncC family amidohydrolase
MKNVIEILTKNNKTISTMESCTGGGLANAITNIEGASEVLKFSAVTYSNEFKIKMGVDSTVIDKYTVYSMETAIEMAKNISNYTNSNYGIGITGKINREDPNNTGGSINTIYVCIYDKDNNTYNKIYIDAIKGTREDNKNNIINIVINTLIDIIK